MLLQKRSNGVYYFRWVYPPALRKLLGKRELLKSLHSSSKAQALSRAGAYYMAVDRFQMLQDSYERGDIRCLVSPIDILELLIKKGIARKYPL